MSQSFGLVAFDALMLRYFILGDEDRFFDELESAKIALRRNFRILITDGILTEYQIESNKFPPFQLQPNLDRLFGGGVMIFFDDYRLDRSLTRSSIQLTGLRQEHRAFIYDPIAARANYLVTTRQSWIDLYTQTTRRYELQIVTPATFVDLEG